MVLGSLSLIFWTLIIVAAIKYVGVAMRIDNHGEGGIMALMALVSGRKGFASQQEALGHRRGRLVRGGPYLRRRSHYARNLRCCPPWKDCPS